MMSNCSRKWQKGSVKYSKLTNEEDRDQVGLLEEVVIVPSSGSIQGPSESLPSAAFGPCYLCPTVGNHRAEVNRLVEAAIGNRPNIDLQSFKLLPVCNIKVPTASGEEYLCLDDIERKYTENFPLWEKEFQCFPEGPIFYDKLFKKEPYTRTIDIENKFLELRKKVNTISETPFDAEKDADDTVIEKTVGSIISSLQTLIKYLELSNNPRIKSGLPKVLYPKVKAKLETLKDLTKVIDIIHEIQDEAFDMVRENDQTCKQEKGYYEMR
jgi:hypothetical protein